MATQPRAYALSASNLVAFHPGNPTIGRSIAISGLNPFENLVGIDFRPQNGFLYGLGHNAGAGTVQLYAISTRTGQATAIGTTGTFVDAGGNPILIGGTSFGFDFNPAADRIRVTTDSGLNFRMNANTGAFIDGDLGGAAGSVTGLNTDGPFVGSTITAAAYTNNQPNTTITTQYTLDAALDRLNIQNPPNSGTQISVGPTGVDFTSVNGFDIAAGVNGAANNAGVSSGTGLAVLTVGGVAGLYNINLVTGAATKVDNFSAAPGPVSGLAIQNDLGGIPVIALAASGGSLVRFNTATPGTSTTVGVSGLAAGEQLVGIDFRPATGQLYGFGVNATANTGTLYRLDPQTGAATIIGMTGQIVFVDGAGNPVDLPSTGGWGMDFNPTTDRIRVTSESGLNFRLNPNTGFGVDGDIGGAAGSVAGVNTDGPINGLPGGSVGVAAVAYTNNYGQPLISGQTTLYTLDSVSNALFIQSPANAGTQVPQVAVTLGGNVLDFTGVNGFDIPSNVAVSVSGTAAVGFGYASLVVGGVTSIYKINLATGVSVNLGFAPAVGLTGLALADAPATTATTDFNRDGMGDVLWRHSSGTVVSWMVDHAGGFATKGLGGPDNGWKVAETGDFNRDGFADVLWRHADGTVVSWLLNATGVALTQTLGAPDNNWRVAESGDFNGDGRSDILWRYIDGATVVWFLDESSSTATASLGNPGADWKVAGVGDFNLDGRSDILWRHDGGTVVAWLMGNGGAFTTQVLGGPDNTWRIEGTGDFNDDLRGDVLWRNANSGEVILWELNAGLGFSTRSLGGPDNSWEIEDVIDTNNDGRTDILWRHDSGTAVAWQLAGAGFTTRSLGSPDSAWQIVSDPTELV